MSALERLFAAHARLKQRIHGYRLPIHSRSGRFAVGVVYFSTPCLVGYGLLQATNVIRDKNLGVNREKLIERKKAWEAEDAKVRRPPVMAVTPVPPPGAPQTTRVL